GLEAALAEARLARMVDPLNAICRALQGMVLLRQGDAGRAEHELRQACDDFPHDAQLWAFLGEAHWRSARHEAALVALERAWELAPSAQLAAQKARMLTARGDLVGAEALLWG